MNGLKLAAMAAVFGLAAWNGEEASAQWYSTAPASRLSMPGTAYYGYQPATYRARPGCLPRPICRPGTVCPNDSGWYGQTGQPAYAVPGGSYGRPVYSQPARPYGTPVYYQPGLVTPNQPYGGYVPGAGHFSVEDAPFDQPAITSVPIDSGADAGSPFYERLER